MPAHGRCDDGWRSKLPVSTPIASAKRCSGSSRYPSLMQMRRGDVVTVAAAGDYGKPRPAVIVQSDAIPENYASVVVCQLTSELVDAPDFRVTIVPTPENGLRLKSQLMADKPVTVRGEGMGKKMGRRGNKGRAGLGFFLAFVWGLANYFINASGPVEEQQDFRRAGLGGETRGSAGTGKRARNRRTIAMLSS